MLAQNHYPNKCWPVATGLLWRNWSGYLNTDVFFEKYILERWKWRSFRSDHKVFNWVGVDCKKMLGIDKKSMINHIKVLFYISSLVSDSTDLHAALQWRHNGRDGVPYHQPRDCLLNRLFRRRSKKTSKLRVTGLCVGNSSVTDEFPAQMTSNAENVSIWWRHHDATSDLNRSNYPRQQGIALGNKIYSLHTFLTAAWYMNVLFKVKT